MTTGIQAPLASTPLGWTGGAAVTAHDSNELAIYAKALYIGGAGAVKVTTPGGSVLTLAAVPVGTILPIPAKLVWSTGTTATNIVALW